LGVPAGTRVFRERPSLGGKVNLGDQSVLYPGGASHRRRQYTRVTSHSTISPSYRKPPCSRWVATRKKSRTRPAWQGHLMCPS